MIPPPSEKLYFAIENEKLSPTQTRPEKFNIVQIAKKAIQLAQSESPPKTLSHAHLIRIQSSFSKRYQKHWGWVGKFFAWLHRDRDSEIEEKLKQAIEKTKPLPKRPLEQPSQKGAGESAQAIHPAPLSATPPPVPPAILRATEVIPPDEHQKGSDQFRFNEPPQPLTPPPQKKPLTSEERPALQPLEPPVVPLPQPIYLQPSLSQEPEIISPEPASNPVAPPHGPSVPAIQEVSILHPLPATGQKDLEQLGPEGHKDVDFEDTGGPPETVVHPPSLSSLLDKLGRALDTPLPRDRETVSASIRQLQAFLEVTPSDEQDIRESVWRLISSTPDLDKETLHLLLDFIAQTYSKPERTHDLFQKLEAPAENMLPHYQEVLKRINARFQDDPRFQEMMDGQLFNLLLHHQFDITGMFLERLPHLQVRRGVLLDLLDYIQEPSDIWKRKEFNDLFTKVVSQANSLSCNEVKKILGSILKSCVSADDFRQFQAIESALLENENLSSLIPDIIDELIEKSKEAESLEISSAINLLIDRSLLHLPRERLEELSLAYLSVLATHNQKPIQSHISRLRFWLDEGDSRARVIQQLFLDASPEQALAIAQWLTSDDLLYLSPETKQALLEASQQHPEKAQYCFALLFHSDPEPRQSEEDMKAELAIQLLKLSVDSLRPGFKEIMLPYLSAGTEEERTRRLKSLWSSILLDHDLQQTAPQQLDEMLGTSAFHKLFLSSPDLFLQACTAPKSQAFVLRMIQSTPKEDRPAIVRMLINTIHTSTDDQQTLAALEILETLTGIGPSTERRQPVEIAGGLSAFSMPEWDETTVQLDRYRSPFESLGEAEFETTFPQPHVLEPEPQTQTPPSEIEELSEAEQKSWLALVENSSKEAAFSLTPLLLDRYFLGTDSSHLQILTRLQMNGPLELDSERFSRLVDAASTHTDEPNFYKAILREFIQRGSVQPRCIIFLCSSLASQEPTKSLSIELLKQYFESHPDSKQTTYLLPLYLHVLDYLQPDEALAQLEKLCPEPSLYEILQQKLQYFLSACNKNRLCQPALARAIFSMAEDQKNRLEGMLQVYSDHIPANQTTAQAIFKELQRLEDVTSPLVQRALKNPSEEISQQDYDTFLQWLFEQPDLRKDNLEGVLEACKKNFNNRMHLYLACTHSERLRQLVTRCTEDPKAFLPFYYALISSFQDHRKWIDRIRELIEDLPEELRTKFLAMAQRTESEQPLVDQGPPMLSTQITRPQIEKVYESEAQQFKRPLMDEVRHTEQNPVVSPPEPSQLPEDVEKNSQTIQETARQTLIAYKCRFDDMDSHYHGLHFPQAFLNDSSLVRFYNATPRNTRFRAAVATLLLDPANHEFIQPNDPLFELVPDLAKSILQQGVPVSAKRAVLHIAMRPLLPENIQGALLAFCQHVCMHDDQIETVKQFINSESVSPEVKNRFLESLLTQENIESTLLQEYLNTFLRAFFTTQDRSYAIRGIDLILNSMISLSSIAAQIDLSSLLTNAPGQEGLRYLVAERLLTLLEQQESQPLQLPTSLLNYLQTTILEPPYSQEERESYASHLQPPEPVNDPMKIQAALQLMTALRTSLPGEEKAPEYAQILSDYFKLLSDKPALQALFLSNLTFAINTFQNKAVRDQILGSTTWSLSGQRQAVLTTLYNQLTHEPPEGE